MLGDGVMVCGHGVHHRAADMYQPGDGLAPELLEHHFSGADVVAFELRGIGVADLGLEHHAGVAAGQVLGPLRAFCAGEILQNSTAGQLPPGLNRLAFIHHHQLPFGMVLLEQCDQVGPCEAGTAGKHFHQSFTTGQIELNTARIEKSSLLAPGIEAWIAALDHACRLAGVLRQVEPPSGFCHLLIQLIEQLEQARHRGRHVGRQRPARHREGEGARVARPEALEHREEAGGADAAQGLQGGTHQMSCGIGTELVLRRRLGRKYGSSCSPHRGWK